MMQVKFFDQTLAVMCKQKNAQFRNPSKREKKSLSIGDRPTIKIMQRQGKTNFQFKPYSIFFIQCATIFSISFFCKRRGSVVHMGGLKRLGSAQLLYIQAFQGQNKMQMISCGNEKVFWSKSLDTPFQCFLSSHEQFQREIVDVYGGIRVKKKQPLPYAYFFIPHSQHSKHFFLIIHWFGNHQYYYFSLQK